MEEELVNLEDLRREYVKLKQKDKEIKDRIKEIESQALYGKLKETTYYPDLQYKITYTGPKDKQEVLTQSVFDTLKSVNLEDLYVTYSKMSLTDFEKMWNENEDVAEVLSVKDDFIETKKEATSESFRVTKMTKKELKEQKE